MEFVSQFALPIGLFITEHTLLYLQQEQQQKDNTHIMSEEEPPTKKTKTGWESHTLNCAEALMKDDEGKHFAALVDAPVQTLQGIGEHAEHVLEALGCSTVKDLATYKFFLLARALKTLSATEKGKRLEGSVMNVDKAVDKDYETKTLTEIVAAPVAALEGLSENAGKLLAALGCKTVGDLAVCKYFCWAEAIVCAAHYEESKTAAERKLEKEMNKLK